jgi:HemY protein
LLFTVAVVAASTLGANDGVVSIFFDPWRFDLSLNLFLLGLAGIVFVLYASLEAIRSLLGLPLRAREWRELKRERAAGAALREAILELYAARYARSQRAAQRALEFQIGAPALERDRDFEVLANLLAGQAAHHLRDKPTRDALAAAAQSRSRFGSATDAALLLAAEWAIDDREATRGMGLLSALPAGVARRTQALRLRLQATRMLKRPLEALPLARLLAKHQGFSNEAASALLRSLALEALDQSYDEGQLTRTWAALDTTDRRDPWVIARAVRRAAQLGHPSAGQAWLLAGWDSLQTAGREGREQLAVALITSQTALGPEWLPLVESGMSQYSREAAMVAAAGHVFAQRQLWGKARRLLEQTASADSLPSAVRRQALRTLAQLARQEGDDSVAANCDQRAAAID